MYMDTDFFTYSGLEEESGITSLQWLTSSSKLCFDCMGFIDNLIWCNVPAPPLIKASGILQYNISLLILLNCYFECVVPFSKTKCNFMLLW